MTARLLISIVLTDMFPTSDSQGYPYISYKLYRLAISAGTNTNEYKINFAFFTVDHYCFNITAFSDLFIAMGIASVISNQYIATKLSIPIEQIFLTT